MIFMAAANTTEGYAYLRVEGGKSYANITMGLDVVPPVDV